MFIDENMIPPKVVLFVHEHPRVLTFATAILVIATSVLSMAAIQLDVRAVDWRKSRIGEIQRAASEALGG